MDLYLLRHGEAQPRELSLPDADRALTAKGKRDVQAIAEQVRKGNVRVDVVLSSPLRRAKETAAIAQRELGVKRLLETKALLPDTAPELLWKELATLDGMDHVLLAGHEPSMSRLVRYLLRAPIEVDFKKGALMRITMPSSGPGVLKWMLTPRLSK